MPRKGCSAGDAVSEDETQKAGGVVADLVAHSSWDEMYAQGNNTPGFLGFIFAYGVASGAAFSWHDYVPSKNQPLMILLEWTEDQLNANLSKGGQS